MITRIDSDETAKAVDIRIVRKTIVDDCDREVDYLVDWIITFSNGAERTGRNCHMVDAVQQIGAVILDEV